MSESVVSLNERFYTARKYSFVLSWLLLAWLLTFLSIQVDSIEVGPIKAKIEYAHLIPYALALAVVYFVYQMMYEWLLSTSKANNKAVLINDYLIHAGIAWIVLQIFLFIELFRTRQLFAALGAGFMLGVLYLCLKLRRRPGLLYFLLLCFRLETKDLVTDADRFIEDVKEMVPIYKKMLRMCLQSSVVIVILAPLTAWLKSGLSLNIIMMFVLLMTLSCALHFLFPLVFMAGRSSLTANFFLELMRYESASDEKS